MQTENRTWCYHPSFSGNKLNNSKTIKLILLLFYQTANRKLYFHPSFSGDLSPNQRRALNFTREKQCQQLLAVQSMKNHQLVSLCLLFDVSKLFNRVSNSKPMYNFVFYCIEV